MNNEKRENCAKRITKALKIRGMKQSELCALTKIPKSSLSQYLSGEYEPKQDRIYLISKVLNVSEAWLMGFDVPMEKNDMQIKNDLLVQAITQMRSDSTLADMVLKLCKTNQKQREIINSLLDTFVDNKPEN